MYIVVREDISPGYQLAQSIHAKDQFTHEHKNIEQDWYVRSNTIAVLAVENEEYLLQIAEMAKDQKLAFSLFFEPDIQAYTAIAIEPCDKTTEMLKELKTAGKRSKKHHKRRNKRQKGEKEEK